MKAHRPAAYLPRRKRKEFPALDPSRALPSGLTWYVLDVSRNWEHRLAVWLEAMGWFTLIPLEEHSRMIPAKDGTIKTRRAGVKMRRVTYHTIWIPGLIFVGFAEAPPWLTILNQPHVHNVLGACHVPQPVPMWEIVALWSLAAGLKRPVEARQAVQLGDAAKFTQGPFRGFVFKVMAIIGPEARRRVVLESAKGSLLGTIEADIEEVVAA